METFILSEKVHFLPIPKTDDFVAFHSFFGNAVRISRETYSSLLTVNKSLSRQTILRKFSISRETLNHLIAIGFLKSSLENTDGVIRERLERRMEKARKGMLIRSLRFLSSGCNIACGYCSIAQLQKERVRKAKFTSLLTIDAAGKFLNLVKTGEHKTAFVRFFGGEPIIDWDAYRDAILFLEMERGDVELKYTLNTNGMLITDEIARFLKEHSITTIVSLDGAKRQHDRFRKFRNGTGTYTHVRRGIEVLQRNNVSFKLNAVLHNGNINHIEDVVMEAKSLGINDIGIDDLCFLGNNRKYTLVDAQAKVKSLTAAYEFGKKVGVGVSGAWTGFRSFTKEKDPIPYCFGNGEELCLNAKGQIFPCYGFLEPIGTIDLIRNCFSNPLYLELAARIPGNIPFCNGCEFQGPCAGECAADMASFKNPSQFRDERCKIRKELFEHVLVSTAQESI